MRAAILILLLAVSVVSAETGQTSGLFLNLPADSRGAGMGEAFSASASGASGVWYNPATLIRSSKLTVSFTHAAYIEEMSYNAFAVGLPVGTKNAFALSGRMFRAGAIEGYTNSGVQSSNFSPQDTMLGLSYARRVGIGGVGLTLKNVSSKIQDSASTIAYDAGLFFQRDRWSLSLASENMGGSLKFQQQAYSLPQRTRLGYTLQARPKLAVNADLIIPKKENGWAALGSEYAVFNSRQTKLLVRAGYNTRNAGDMEGLHNLSAGGSIEFNGQKIHYAWAPFGDLGQTHRFSLDFAFNSPLQRSELDEVVAVSSGTSRRKPAPLSQNAKLAALSIPKFPWRKQPFPSMTSDKSVFERLSAKELCHEHSPQALMISKSGLVFIEDDERDSDWAFSKKQLYLFEADTLGTKMGSAQLLFMNGSRMDIESHSEVVFKPSLDPCQSISVKIENGDAILSTDKKKPFQIETPFGVIDLMEATARISVDRKGLRLDVSKGKATFKNGGESMSVSDGLSLQKKKDQQAAISKMESESSSVPEMTALPEDSQLPGRWDPTFFESFTGALETISKNPGVLVADYRRDEKLRESLELAIVDLNKKVDELQSQKDSYDEDIRMFQEIEAEARKAVRDSDTYSAERRNKLIEIERTVKSAERARDEIHGRLRAVKKEIRKQQKEMAEIPLGRLLNITLFETAYTFDPGKHVMSETSQTTLDNFAALLKELKPTRVMVVDHSVPEAEGKRSYRKKLSLKRAETAGKFLMEKMELQINQIVTRGDPQKPNEEEKESPVRTEIWLEVRGL